MTADGADPADRRSAGRAGHSGRSVLAGVLMGVGVAGFMRARVGVAGG